MVSKELGISSSQLRRLVYIFRNKPEYIELLDKGILTVNQSYLQIQREEKEKESRESIPLLNQIQSINLIGDSIRNPSMIEEVSS